MNDLLPNRLVLRVIPWEGGWGGKTSCHMVNLEMSLAAERGDFLISADQTLKKYFCDFQMFRYL